MQLPKRFNVPRDYTRLLIILVVIIGVVTCVAVFVAIIALSRSSTTAGQAKTLAEEVQSTQRDLQASRENTSPTICKAINQNAKGTNRTVDFITDIFVQAQSMAETPAEAAEIRRRITELRELPIPPINCQELQRQILEGRG